MSQTEDSSGGTLAAALLQLARSAAADQPEEVLATVAHAVVTACGYETVLLNIFRPAWDDYKATVIVGSPEVSEALTGTTVPRTALERLLADGEETFPGIFAFTGEDSPAWDDIEHVYMTGEPSDDPDAWQPTDALLVMLSDGDGPPLGFVSVDDPPLGRRPSQADLRLLRTVCAHAEEALRAVRRTRAAEADRQILARLSELSPLLSSCRSAGELHSQLAMAAERDLGFDRIAVYVTTETGDLSISQSRGWERDGAAPQLDHETVSNLLAPAQERLGCWLLKAEELGVPHPPSRRNGRGILAWSDHALLIPWFGPTQEPLGLLILEDPVDRLLPSAERCRAARLLVDLTAAIARSIDQTARLAQQAIYDPLTGLRNRRGLHSLLDQSSPVAVLLCDLDRFKSVNDVHGHEVGDTVLKVFANLLTDLVDSLGVVFRLGGEEFCVILPEATLADGEKVAAAVCRLTPLHTREVIPEGVTVSIGLTAAIRPQSARSLMSAADAALYSAKRAGRDRVVTASPNPSAPPT